MSYARYLQAERELNEGLIRPERSRAEASPTQAQLEARMAEMGRFLDEADNPQAGIPAVHVTGTSGKGSVAAMIALALQELGFSVGLHISPYLQAATEKIAVNGRLVAADAFSDLVDWVLPIAKPRVKPQTPASIHGMASVAIAFEAFRRAQVDVIVCEVGSGGRFDLTSFLNTVTAVVTNVGLDHLVSLGPTLEHIAWHKAGIARPGVPLITGATGRALDVIAAEAHRIGAPLFELPPVVRGHAHNRALAQAAAVHATSALGRSADTATIEHAVTLARLPGRFERMPGSGPVVFLDGAHNPDKLAVAVDAALADATTGPRIAVFGLLGTKTDLDIAASLAGRFDTIIVTEPVVYAKPVTPAETTAKLLSTAAPEITVIKDLHAAFERGLGLAGSTGTVLATGSFYLIGALRERYYPKREVVLQRSSWPSSASAEK